MCTDIYMPDGGEISNRREIKRALPKIIYRQDYYIDDYDPADDDGEICLCAVDMRATARANGYRAIPFGAGDVYFVKRGQRLRNHAEVKFQEAHRL